MDEGALSSCTAQGQVKKVGHWATAGLKEQLINTRIWGCAYSRRSDAEADLEVLQAQKEGAVLLSYRITMVVIGKRTGCWE